MPNLSWLTLPHLTATIGVVVVLIVVLAHIRDMADYNRELTPDKVFSCIVLAAGLFIIAISLWSHSYVSYWQVYGIQLTEKPAIQAAL